MVFSRAVVQVRAAYAETDFEWDQVRRLSVTGTKEANVTILRKTLTSTTSLDKLAEGKGDT